MPDRTFHRPERVTTTPLPDATSTDAPARPGRRRRVVLALGAAGGAVLLFLMYWRMSYAEGGRSDAASNALQAWDMLHGNLVLHGWTVTDVSFWTTEVPEFALVELVTGFNAGAVQIAAALTYTLIVVTAAALAKGRLTGRPAVAAVVITVAALVAPARGWGYHMLLQEPDHVGTAVPVLVTWLVLERVTRARVAVPLITLLLVWEQLGDPLAMFVAAVPLTIVSIIRMARKRGFDALVLAGPASVLLTYVILTVVHRLGGFDLHPAGAEFAAFGRLGYNAKMTVESWALNYGAYFPDLTTGPERLIGALHVITAVLAAAAVFVALWRTVRNGDDRVTEVLAVGVLVNLLAFVLSTQPGSITSSRQIAPTMAMAAVLAGRVWGPPIARLRLVPVAGALLGVFLVAGAAQAAAITPDRPEAADVASWLRGQGLTRGVGAYWAANIVTLQTRGEVRVAPLAVVDPVAAYNWESRRDWYDPARGDARFVIFDRAPTLADAQALARQRFGEPVREQAFTMWVVWVYDHNVLDTLPADCVPGGKPSIAQCPPIAPEIPALSLLSKHF